MALSDNSMGYGLNMPSLGGVIHRDDTADAMGMMGQALRPEKYTMARNEAVLAPRPAAIKSPMERESIDDEEAATMIGTYIMNFVGYGLMPCVEQHTNQGQWKVTLQATSGQAFSMEIVADALIDALRQADMAAGGWHAQREIERDLLREKFSAASDAMTESGSTSGIISQLLDAQRVLDENAVPHSDRYLLVSPAVAQELRGGSPTPDGMDGMQGELYGTKVFVDPTLKSNQPQMVPGFDVPPHLGSS